MAGKRATTSRARFFYFRDRCQSSFCPFALRTLEFYRQFNDSRDRSATENGDKGH